MIARSNAIYQGHTPMATAVVSSMSKKKMINVRKRCTRETSNRIARHSPPIDTLLRFAGERDLMEVGHSALLTLLACCTKICSFSLFPIAQCTLWTAAQGRPIATPKCRHYVGRTPVPGAEHTPHLVPDTIHPLYTSAPRHRAA